MTAVIPPSDAAERYRIEPTVLQGLRSPRILTREVLAGLGLLRWTRCRRSTRGWASTSCSRA